MRLISSTTYVNMDNMFDRHQAFDSILKSLLDELRETVDKENEENTN